MTTSTPTEQAEDLIDQIGEVDPNLAFSILTEAARLAHVPFSITLIYEPPSEYAGRKVTFSYNPDTDTVHTIWLD